MLAELLEPRTLLTTFFVNSLADGAPVVDGAITLREALLAANSNSDVADAPAGSVNDVIRFDPQLFESLPDGAPAKIQLQGQLEIEGNVFIFGPGAEKLSIDAGGNTFRVFAVDGNALISGVEVTGGGFGGIVNRGDLRLVDSVVSKNTGIIGGGGGITHFGSSLVIENSIIRENRSTSDGGGIAADRGEVRIIDSALIGNAALGDGGGVAFRSDNNLATPRVQADLTNVTFSANVAERDGGAVALLNGKLEMFHTTITGNSSDFDGNGTGDGGGIHNDGGSLFMTSTIVAGNFRGTLDNEIPSDLSGLLDPDASHANLIGDPNSASLLLDRNDPEVGFRSGNIIGDGNGGLLPIDDVLDTVIRTTSGRPVHTLGIDSVAIDQGLPTYEPLIAVDGAEVHFRFSERGEGIVVDRDLLDFRIADSTAIDGFKDAFLEGSPNLEVMGPTTALGSAIEFDGVDDRVLTAPVALDDFTVSFWFKTNDRGPTGNQWFDGNALFDVFNDLGFGVSILGTRLAFGVGSNNPADNETIISDVSVTDGQWRHVAVTRDGSTGRMFMYIDGLVHRFADGPTGPRVQRGVTLGNRLASSNFYQGSMDEVAIFDKVLTPSQVRQQVVSANLPLGDQRGFTFRRSVFEQTPFDRRFGAPDIGAFERQPGSQISPTVFEVSTDVDESDGNFSPGDLSLREAIELANRSPDRNRITFAEGLAPTFGVGIFSNLVVSQVLDLQFGQIPIEFDVTIEGPGRDNLRITNVAGPAFESIFTVSEVARVDISGVTLNSTSSFAIENRGQLSVKDVEFSFNNGSILNLGFEAQLDVVDSDFFDNSNSAIQNLDGTATIGPGVEFFGNTAFDGAAILNTGDLKVTQVVFGENTASDNGVLGGSGGAIFSEGSFSVLEVDRSQFIGNSASNVGGAIAAHGELKIFGSTFTDNRTQDPSLSDAVGGGGVFIDLRDAPAGTRSVIRSSTLNGNRSAQLGGGILSFSAAGSDVEFENNTVWNNVASQSGGGIFAGDDGSQSALTTLQFNTIARNSLPLNFQNGSGVRLDARFVMNSNIIADNRNGQLIGADLFTNGSTNLGAVDNIISGPTADVNVLTNRVATDPKLESELADNGGLTKTVKLQLDSPAIDASAANRLVDQRGFPVIDQQGIGNARETSDAGAYELEPIQVDFYDSSTASFNSQGVQTGNTVSQFVESTGQVQFGLGYDDGRSNSQIPSEPGFLGFKFDPDPYSFGGIGEGLFGDRYGAEVTLDFSGRAGIEYGYYLNAGSVGINYDSMFRTLMSETTPNTFEIQTASFLEDGSLFTVSPRVGAYADLVFELNASVSGVGCLVACTSPFRLPINLGKTIPLFSINRQRTDSNDNPLSSNGAPLLDGELKFGAGSIGEILADEDGGAAQSFLEELSEIREERTMAKMEMAQAEQDLRRDPNDQDAQDRLDDSRERVQKADADEKKKSKKKDSGGLDLCAGTFVTACIGAASDGLLGVEATLGVGAAIGPVSVNKPIGSIQVTVPEIQLSDTELDDRAGTLSATTDDFAFGSEEDNNRQIAKLSVDVAGVLGPILGIPAGRYEAELGDILSVSLQTISYDVQPRLLATQDVQATPFFHTNAQLDAFGGNDDAKRGANLIFSPAENVVNVKVDGVSKGAVSNIWFQPGSTLEVTTDGDPVTVTPEVRLGHKFSNDIGLDIDVKGILEALAINVEVFGKTIVDIGPLIRYEHQIGSFGLGSVFKTDTPLNLSTTTAELTPFTLGQTIGMVMDGNTPGGAVMLDVGVENFGSPSRIEQLSGRTKFFSFPTTITEDDGNGSTSVKAIETLDFNIERVGGGSPEVAVIVAQPGITLIDGRGPDAERILLEPNQRQGLLNDGNWSLEGFDPRFGDGRAFVGIENFTSLNSLDVTARGVLRETTFVTGELIDSERIEAINNDSLPDGRVVNPFFRDGPAPGTFAPLDIDQNGAVSVQHDMVLVQQFLNGMTPSSFFIGPGATLTTDDQLLARLQALEADGTLDANEDGLVNENDAALISMVYFGQGNNDMDPEDESAVDSLIRGLLGRTISSGINNAQQRAARQAAEQGLQMTRTAGDDFLGIRSTNEAAGRVSAFEIGDDAVLGSSPWMPYELVQAGDDPAAELANFGSPVQLEDIVVRVDPGMPDNGAGMPGAAIVASSAAGTPPRLMPMVETFAELAQTRDRDMIEDVPVPGMDTRQTSRMTRSASLGQDSDAPIFFRLPDAGGWDISIPDGVLITDIVFDTNVGGNQYLNHDPRLDGTNIDFDIFFPETGQRVEFSMDRGEDGYARLSEIGINVVTRFLIYPRALPTATLQRIDNLERPEIDLIVGLVLDDSFALAPGEPPLVIAKQLYAREEIFTPNAIVAEPDRGTFFSIERNDLAFDVNGEFTTRVELAVNGRGQEFTVGEDNTLISNAFPSGQFPSSAFAKIEFLGSSRNDTLQIGNSDLPLFIPIEFDGGGGDFDALSAGGAGVHLDLTTQISIRNIEFIDLFVTGSNTLTLDAQAVYDNDPGRRSLIIDGTSQDQIHALGDGWMRRDEREDLGFGPLFDVWVYNDGKNAHLAGVQLFVNTGINT